MARGTIVVAGALAQKPRHGGHAWVLLQYVLGFKRLGWDVLFLDHLSDGAGTALGIEPFLRLMRNFGLEKEFALFLDGTQETIGLSRSDVAQRVRNAAFLLNVMGFFNDPEALARAPRRVFLDIDPGFPQMWCELGLHDAFAGHDDVVTIGQNIGRADCAIPTCGLNWIVTPQPVVLEHWPAMPCAGPGRFTSVGTWRGTNGPVEYRGTTYGLRVHEFRKFAALPCMTGREFELALDIHPSEVDDLALLRRGGWSLVDPLMVAANPRAYQAYVQASAAEFMVAKHMYVATNSGWFSDRSICYLASGKPVLAQDTGLGPELNMDRKGLVIFRSLEEARAGVDEIMCDYTAHARAARRLAEEHFDSDVVLTRLLANLGVI
jgi:hypothetical protein